MSGRIRTVKPEWLEDENIAAASDAARVLSVSLILMADDYGNGRASTAMIATETWRYEMERDDGANARETLMKASRALRELLEIGFVDLYSVSGQRYFAIRNWSKHQKVSHPGKPRVPGPDCGTKLNDSGNSGESSRNPRESVANSSGEPRETLVPDLRPPTTINDHDQLSSELPPTQGPAKPDPVRLVFDAWLEEHIDPKQRSKCKLNGKRRSKIQARLREYPPERLIAAIRGVKRSPFHMGDNAEGKRWTDLAVILRDGEQVEKFEALLEAPPPATGRRRPSIAQPSPASAFDPEGSWAEFERQLAAGGSS